ncbi:hypothetical protein DPEC_G00040200 [Dallia pectoralis]|uniref:Uncharacterized protein n=1 Tax=Dallia pectoralis TaxID=75939 RepID=A0ACC2HFA6_DALPE|nr:hypothetical protein DPEC_G00040200 [Dallia pectoralis]
MRVRSRPISPASEPSGTGVKGRNLGSVQAAGADLSPTSPTGGAVRFERISANTEEVTLDSKSQAADGGNQLRLDSDEDLGYTDKVKHKINLVDDTPVTQPYRRIPPTQYKEVKDHITMLHKKGVIQASSSSYASPVVLVPKLGAIEQRWVAQLAVFDFEVKYRPGRCNAAADALSRQPFAGEPEAAYDDAEFDGCTAICNIIWKGTALESD